MSHELVSVADSKDGAISTAEIIALDDDALRQVTGGSGPNGYWSTDSGPNGHWTD